MPSRWHSMIQQAILDFGKSNRKVKRVRSNQPLHINHPTKKLVMLYYPDVYFELKNRKKVVFEVIDKQSNDKTVADIFRCFLSPNVSQVYFVVKSSAKEKEVSEMCDIILSKLADEFNTKKSKLPIEVNVITITEEEAQNEENLNKLLQRLITI